MLKAVKLYGKGLTLATLVFAEQQQMRFMLKLTSQQEFAIWQPAWPTRRSKDVSIGSMGRCAARREILTVDTDDFSHVDGLLLMDLR